MSIQTVKDDSRLEENPFTAYMDWAEYQNALIEQEQKCRYVPTDDDIFIVDYEDQEEALAWARQEIEQWDREDGDD